MDVWYHCDVLFQTNVCYLRFKKTIESELAHSQKYCSASESEKTLGDCGILDMVFVLIKLFFFMFWTSFTGTSAVSTFLKLPKIPVVSFYSKKGTSDG